MVTVGVTETEGWVTMGVAERQGWVTGCDGDTGLGDWVWRRDRVR